MVLVFLTGGPSHLDSFDPKPDSSDGIRGEFQSIDTAVPGVRFCEHPPQLAAHAGKLSVMRSMWHRHYEPPERHPPAVDRPRSAGGLP